MSTDFNIPPYWDDYNEEKSFYKILFKPSLAVQARELTQLQTALQKQIDRFGTHVFKEGAKVLGCEFGYSNEYHSVKLASVIGDVSVDDFIDRLIGIDIKGTISGVEGTIENYTKSTETDPPTIFVKYNKTGSDKSTQTFIDGEELTALTATVTVANQNVLPNYPLVTTAGLNCANIGAAATIESGVIFVQGYFVYVPKQVLILSKYTNNPSSRVGLQIVESVVTANEDTSLLDNAQGTSNFAAPGADRYSIDLVLSSLPADSEDDANFIELERTNAGTIVTKARTSDYNVLGDNLAERTYEINGDFIKNKFACKMRESVKTALNNGVYDLGATTNSGNIANDNLYAMQISSGKAFVNGYRIEMTAPSFIDVNKPRDFESEYDNLTSMEVGNFIQIKDVYGAPDVVSNSGSVDPYRAINLYSDIDAPLAPTVPSTDTQIGVTRARMMEFADSSGTQDALNGIYKLFIFDTRMFTEVELSTAVTPVPGERIEGLLSGAAGTVHSASGTNPTTTLKLINVSGDFADSEEFKRSSTDSTFGAGIVSTTVRTRKLEEVKSLFSEAPAGYTNGYFKANTSLDSRLILSGTVSVDNTLNTVTGFNTLFLSQLIEGDVIEVVDTNGVTEQLVVASVDSDSQITLTANPTFISTNIPATRTRAELRDPEKGTLVRKLDKRYVKTLIDPITTNVQTSYDVTREFIVQSNANGEISFSAPLAGEEFKALSNADYQITVIGNPNGLLAVGDVVNVDSANIPAGNVTGEGTGNLTITSVPLFGTGTWVKAICTLTKNKVEHKEKDAIFMQTLHVEDKSEMGGSIYGTSSHHTEISMGYPDVYKIRAIYCSNQIGVVPTLPSMTVAYTAGPTAPGTQIIGQTSGAVATIISTAGNWSFVKDNNIDFVSGESITDVATSSLIATVASNVVPGSVDVKDRFMLDTGQRDNFYDVARLSLKKRSTRPVGDLLVVFDYFRHEATGDYFTVDSYNDLDYSEIPYYSSTKIDPEANRPNGQFDLRSCIDFRPTVASNLDTSGTYPKVVARTLDFESRSYVGTGASLSATPRDNTNLQYYYEYYLARKDALFLSAKGEFVYLEGSSAVKPQAPDDLNNALRIADIQLNPYGIDIEEVSVKIHPARGYTMKDISLLEQRLSNVEYYTSLTLLEKSAESHQVKDADGFDRFKSGFVVDNFAGHGVGDVAHVDYRCAVDMRNKTLRPQYVSKNVSLREVANTRNERNAAGYQRTGRILTLPYTEVVSAEQPYATRVENLNPVLRNLWIGKMTLSPSRDIWFETDRAPTLTNNRDGNFDSVLTKNQDAIGTIWDAPVTMWSGWRREDFEVLTPQVQRPPPADAEWFGWSRGRQNPNVGRLGRETQVRNGVQTQNGIDTNFISSVDIEQLEDRVISTAVLPYIRQNVVQFSASGMKPFTRVYPFFDKIAVSENCWPKGGATVRKVTSTTPVSVTRPLGVWNYISKIAIYYDNNVARALNFRLEISDNGTDGWLELAAANTSAVPSAFDVDTVEFNVGANVISANTTGEKFIRITATRPDGSDFFPISQQFSISQQIENLQSGNVAANSELEIHEIVFFDQNGAQIDNSSYAQIDSFYNFIDPKYMVDSAGNFDPTSIVPDEVTNLEAWVPRSWETESSVSIRLIGGTPSVSQPVSNTSFIVTGDIDDNALVTDANGNVSGTFLIPDPTVDGNPKFEAGTRQFRLTSSEINSEQSASSVGTGIGVSTWAQANYTAAGILRTIQSSFVSTRNARIETTDLQITTQVEERRERVGWFDPLAQSVLIKSEGGEFITSVDVFFAAKDNVLPVTCQLRTMENGYPTTTVFPNGEVTLPPYKVAVSDDASVATRFTFPEPIFIKENVEVAVTLITDSQKYFAYISRMGEQEVGGVRYVSDQPYLGVLFKSQNSSTWTAYDFEDLKFRLNRASFNTSVGTVTLENEPVARRRLPKDPFEFTKGSNTVKVIHPNHHMYDSPAYTYFDNLTTGVAGTITSTITAAASSVSVSTASLSWPNDPINAKYFVLRANNKSRWVDEVIQATSTFNAVTGNYDLTIVNRNVNAVTARRYFAGTTIELFEIAGVGLHELNKTTLQIDNQQIDSYTVTVATTPNTTIKFGGSNIYADENVNVDSYQMMVPTIVLPSTTLSSNLFLESGTSPSGNQQSYLGLQPLGEVIPTLRYDVTSTKLVASQTNENEVAGNKSVNAVFTLSTERENLSPVIDTEAMSLICHSNRLDDVFYSRTFRSLEINNLVGTFNNGDVITSSTGAKAQLVDASVMSYFIIDGASDFAVGSTITNYDGTATADVVNVVVPPVEGSTNVYPPTDYIPPTAAEGDSGATSYITRKVQLQTPATAIKVLFDAVVNGSNAVEVLYKVQTSDDVDTFDDLGWTYFNGDGSSDEIVSTVNDRITYQEHTYSADDLPEFSSFAIKIVMRGNNSSVVPLIKDLRAIALAI